MKVIEIHTIVRKDVPIYYRRVYSGVASLELLGKRLEKQIEFSVEIKPTGSKEIGVSLQEDVDYPLLPLIKQLREVVAAMERAGALPC
jgi:hypothetical protein